MAKEAKKGILSGSLIFLFPTLLIKKNHLSKKDVKTIKGNLTTSFSQINFIVAIVLIALIAILHVFMEFDSNFHYIEVYDIMSLVGQIILVTGAIVTIVLILISKNTKKRDSAVIYARIAGDILYLGASLYMLCCVIADARMKYTFNSETLSAGIIFIAILVLIQPMHWTDAVILNLFTSLGIVAIAIYGALSLNMGALLYYILIALIFPFAGYMVTSLLFYAETQRYKEILENEKLHNRAYYDNLTRCKNRHALSEYLKENKSRWKRKENVNLLMVLFDIDNFKLYNDQFSHLGGDYCLRSICDAIRQEFPSPSLDFFRYGGEEFLLFFELKEPEEAPMILEKVREAISGLDIVAPNGAPKKMVTISVGGMLLRNVKEFVFEEEMKTVDEYLYKAKNSGKDVVCYNGQLIN